MKINRKICIYASSNLIALSNDKCNQLSRLLYLIEKLYIYF